MRGRSPTAPGPGPGQPPTTSPTPPRREGTSSDGRPSSLTLPNARGGTLVALLGPTNTGKTHRAIERMLDHHSGMFGLPLRLLAREVYDRLTERVGEDAVALVTGEEKRVPARPRYWVCTVEAMPSTVEVDFVVIDEIQLCAHPQRGHVFTDRLLHARGRVETWFLGADTVRDVISRLLPSVEIRRHPRLSSLRAVPSVDVGSLAPRSAAVAFSVDDVYALAERLRKGGAAVVLGALSPRTRNAQVAAYQAGELRHMVATDAIGMGLNLDIDHVVFATTHKFDGSGHRDLDAAELAQIAGRAGRYERDGTFGTLLPQRPLPPALVHAIEEHRFPRVQTLYWRSSDLDFSSLPALLASLDRPAPVDFLRVPELAPDLEALRQVARIPEVHDRARGELRVRTLWALCQIPNYRKEPLDAHVGLITALWRRLAEGRERVDSDWLARRIDRLDDPHGDLPVLVDRIASIRTWTYVSNHEEWVESARWWQARTREIEDSLSDALHLQLLARFGSARRPAPRGEAEPSPSARELRAPTSTGGPFEALAQLRALAAARPGEYGDLGVPGANDERWIDTLVEASSRDFTVGDDLRLQWRARRLGRLTRGRDLLHPELALEGDVAELSPGARLRVRRRAVAALRDLVQRWLEPLRRLDRDCALRIGAPARGLLYALEADLGVVETRRVRSQLRSLRPGDQRLLSRHGIAFGTDWIVTTPLAQAEHDRLREALVGAWLADAVSVPPPPTAAQLLAVEGPLLHDVERWLARVWRDGAWVPLRDRIT